MVVVVRSEPECGGRREVRGADEQGKRASGRVRRRACVGFGFVRGEIDSSDREGERGLKRGPHAKE